jgi:type II secretory pathway component PulL
MTAVVRAASEPDEIPPLVQQQWAAGHQSATAGQLYVTSWSADRNRVAMHPGDVLLTRWCSLPEVAASDPALPPPVTPQGGWVIR